MSFPRSLRLARRLSVAAALTCAAAFTACGEGLDDDESVRTDDEAIVEINREAIGGRNLPGEGDVLQFDGIVIPQEAPVCQDCKTPGWALGLTTIGGVPHLTLRALSAGTQVSQVVPASFVPTGDYIYVVQRQFVNGVWQDVPVWQSPINGFDHVAWYRVWNDKVRNYIASTGVPLIATPMSLVTAAAALRAQMAVASNWRGEFPLFKAYVMVTGPVAAGAVRNPILFP